MTEIKGFEYKGFTFYSIGCKKCCCFPPRWDVKLNLDTKNFIAVCTNCGNISEIEIKYIKNQPEK